MMKLGYILSHAYSGSTLISLMLGAHSQIIALGEFHGGSPELVDRPDMVDAYLCSCGVPVLDCPFWRDLAEFLQNQGVRDACFPNLGNRFMPGRRMWLFKTMNRSLRSGALEHLRRMVMGNHPGARRHIIRVCRNNRLAMEWSLEKTKTDVFVDASKNPARLEYLTFTPDLEIFPILLTRDPRGVALSVMKRHKGDARAAAVTWRRYHLFAIRTLHRMRIPYHHLRYEDLCRNPHEQMDQLHRFLGIQPEGWPPPSALPEYHVLGNDMRLSFDGAVHPPASWQDALTEPDRQVISRICGPLMWSMGYQDD